MPSLRADSRSAGHAGRKLRSALSLGKHISWLIHGSIDTCTCDGCKSTSKAQRVPRNVKDDTKRKSKGKGRATLWGGGSDDDDGEDGDEVEDSFLSEREEGVDYDEESEMSHASPKKRPKLSTTGAGRQQPMSEALRNAFKQVDTFPLPPRHEFFAMTPLKADAMDELKLKASQKEDVENPELSRVGELVWAEVDVPQGRSSVTHWPGIVKRRELVEGGGEVSADYVVDLLGLDSTVQVVGMGVVPWLSFEEPNARDIVDEGDDTQVAAAVERKWTLETLRSEGEAVVGALFLFAVQIGNWMSTMQIRSCILPLLSPPDFAETLPSPFAASQPSMPAFTSSRTQTLPPVPAVSQPSSPPPAAPATSRTPGSATAPKRSGPATTSASPRPPSSPTSSSPKCPSPPSRPSPPRSSSASTRSFAAALGARSSPAGACTSSTRSPRRGYRAPRRRRRPRTPTDCRRRSRATCGASSRRAPTSS